jgi:hypothetical protein
LRHDEDDDEEEEEEEEEAGDGEIEKKVDLTSIELDFELDP